MYSNMFLGSQLTPRMCFCWSIYKITNKRYIRDVFEILIHIGTIVKARLIHLGGKMMLCTIKLIKAQRNY